MRSGICVPGVVTPSPHNNSTNYTELNEYLCFTTRRILCSKVCLPCCCLHISPSEPIGQIPKCSLRFSIFPFLSSREGKTTAVMKTRELLALGADNQSTVPGSEYCILFFNTYLLDVPIESACTRLCEAPPSSIPRPPYPKQQL